MSQKKGQTRNLNGRTKGSKNKVSAQIKEQITNLLEYRFENFVADYNSIADKTVRCKLHLETAKLIIPKPKDPEEEEENELRHRDLLDRLFPRTDKE